MSFAEEFKLALRQQRTLMKHRPGPLYVRLLVYLSWLVGFGMLFAVIHGLESRRIGSAAWWLKDVPGHLVVSACITLCFFSVFRAFERFAPQRWLDTITGWHDWRSRVFFTVMSVGCSIIGLILGLAVVDRIWQRRDLDYVLAAPGFWAEFLGISTFIALTIGWRYRSRWKQEQLQARVTEAQLRLLQGQIEPHFLFNTLANVQSLIDFDPERAKLMLERFTDYLRASLGQLRGETTTLTQEFAMLEAYLGLMQLRMGQRLRVRLALPSELAGFELPPLLIQPLVENAIHHGLEPKIGGGEIVVSARREAGGLVIDVEDDGQGLDGPKRRSGNGVALANIRARLSARWGLAATLELLPRGGGGTLARILIPSAALPT